MATSNVDRRLEAVEAALAGVGERLDALARSLETTVHAAVATEVHAAVGELRHSVSELGRILVRDVGKLPHMLAQHREAIVAELLEAAAAEPPIEGAAEAPPIPEPAIDPSIDVTTMNATAAPPLSGPAPAAAEGGGDRRWRSRRRHQG